VQIAGRRCIIPPGLDLLRLPFPDNVQGVVTSRIDRLTPGEQLALKVASVIGRSFSSAILKDVCPIEEDKPNLGRHLDVLCDQALTVLDAPIPERAYSFKHVITQEVSYQMMAPAQRKELHGSVAAWYESRYASDLSAYYPLLAKHWSSTDEVEKAIAYSQRSGENAMRDFAHEEAVTFFGQALELDARAWSRATPSVRAYWHRQLGEAYYNLSDLNKAREHFWTALGLLGYPSPKTGAGYVLGSLRDFVVQLCHRAAPAWFIGRARKDGPALLESARAYERLAQIHYLNNAKISSVHAVFRSLNFSESVGGSPELARSYANAAVITGLLMLHHLARAQARRARDMARTVNHPSCTAYVEFICGLYFNSVGNFAEAETALVESVQISDRIGEKRRWYEASFTLAAVLSRKGDFEGAYALSRELHSSARRRLIPQVEVWGVTWELWTLLVIAPNDERTTAANATLQAYLAAYPNLSLGDRILGLAFRALALWRRGDAGAARACSDEVEAIIASTNQVSHYLLEAYSGLGEVYIGLRKAAKNDSDTMRLMDARLRQVIKILNQFALMYPIASARKYLVRGWFRKVRGHTRGARRDFERCLSAAQKYGMPHERNIAMMELSKK
jgi:tetratricopeptide (TPR) repeat protein